MPLRHVIEDDGAGGLRVAIRIRNGTAGRTTAVSQAFLDGPELKELSRLEARLHELGASPWTLLDGDKQHVIEHGTALYRLIDQRGRKGATIQRYKGLGEMSAEQLWETTMDPAERVLLQVTLDDAAAADEIFSILMGEDVESRRGFIQRNARDVRFLDI